MDYILNDFFLKKHLVTLFRVQKDRNFRACTFPSFISAPDSSSFITTVLSVTEDFQVCQRPPIYNWSSTTEHLLLIIYNWTSTTDLLQLNIYNWSSTTEHLQLIIYDWSSTTDHLDLIIYNWSSTNDLPMIIHTWSTYKWSTNLLS
jgi:hypothetical protein